ncbi:hypothetical protein HanPSC8_Chr16g0742661 [Helianthus annuus]|nr:hypothetical protein HanPSC8_Chr16g0742661 [Helianthus annuus]
MRLVKVAKTAMIKAPHVQKLYWGSLLCKERLERREGFCKHLIPASKSPMRLSSAISITMFNEDRGFVNVEEMREREREREIEMR